MFGRRNVGCRKCGDIDNMGYSTCCDRALCKDCLWGHERYSRCAFHSNEGHKGSWKTCEECEAEGDCFEDSLYGFSDEEDEEDTPKKCKRCQEDIDLLKSDYTKKGKDFYCIECYIAEITPAQKTKVPRQASKEQKTIQFEIDDETIEDDQSEENTSRSSLSQSNVKNEEGKTSKTKIKATGRKSDLSDEKNSEQKYGKRKAQGEGEEESNRSTSSGIAKKVKKSEEEKGSENKKMVEINNTDSASKTRREASIDSAEGKRSSSAKEKKKVQGNQKKV